MEFSSLRLSLLPPLDKRRGDATHTHTILTLLSLSLCSWFSFQLLLMPSLAVDFCLHFAHKNNMLPLPLPLLLVVEVYLNVRCRAHTICSPFWPHVRLYFFLSIFISRSSTTVATLASLNMKYIIHFIRVLSFSSLYFWCVYLILLIYS